MLKPCLSGSYGTGKPFVYMRLVKPKLITLYSFSSLTFDNVVFLLFLTQVQYNINGWLDKNKDPIQECIVQLMQESKEPLVSLFFKDPEEGGKYHPAF